MVGNSGNPIVLEDMPPSEEEDAEEMM